MEITGKTASFLSTLREYSGGNLPQEKDIGLLMEIAEEQGKQELFDRIAFLAKFATSARKIMERIGPGGEGYDKLSHEFTKAIGDSSALLRELTGGAQEEAKAHFRDAYLGLSPQHLDRLLALLRGMTWYKNWSIDHHRRET